MITQPPASLCSQMQCGLNEGNDMDRLLADLDMPSSLVEIHRKAFHTQRSFISDAYYYYYYYYCRFVVLMCRYNTPR
jgi:hypothetical protein